MDGGKSRQLLASGLFDASWYLDRNQDVARAGADALTHFLHHGWAEGRWPNRCFDPAWYRLDNPGIAADGADPLLHYIAGGERAGRKPHPLFDPAWYRRAYHVPPQQLALAHFVAERRGGAVVPSPGLFPVPLLAPWRGDPDPVTRYLDDMEGQEAFPDLHVVRASGLLDENYYLINAADVREAELDPADHYCRYGWRENRKPNIYFDPLWYTQTNPEVGRLHLNPLVHYILVGEAANRRPVPFFDPGWYRAAYRLPAAEAAPAGSAPAGSTPGGSAPGEAALGNLALAHYLANRRSQRFSPTPLFDVARYVARFTEALGPNRDPFAHYLQAGMTQDIDPSPGFDAARYRQRHMGRPSRGFLRMLRPDRHNPLVHYLRAEYEGRLPEF